MMLGAIRLVAVLGAILFLVPTAAFATTVREAFELCDKDPKCKSTVTKAGDVIFTNGSYVVSCPMEGPCSCDVCGAVGTAKSDVIRPAQPADFHPK